MRHPLDWYESFYLYKSQPSLNWERDGEVDNFHRWHPNAVLNGLGEGRDFNDFVSAVMDRYPGYVTPCSAITPSVPSTSSGSRRTCARISSPSSSGSVVTSTPR